MGRIVKHWRIIAASFFSLVLVVSAYSIARGVTAPPVAEASEESALLKAIATRDTDSDGLPDWEEALYGTSPTTPDSLHLGMTDGEAVAKGLIVPKAIADAATPPSAPGVDSTSSLPIPADGTLTSAFAKNFFTLYMSAVQQTPDGNLSESDMQKIATEALSQLSDAVVRAPDFKSPTEITVTGSGPEAMKAFAASAEAVFLANTANATTSEIFYLKSALENNDTTAFAHIASIAKVYRATAAGLAVLPVPKELAVVDLELINTMARLSEIIEDFKHVNDDPLTAMLALQQYTQAVQNFSNSLIHFGQAYKTAGVTVSKGQPGASLVNLISDVIAEQKAAKKP